MILTKKNLKQVGGVLRTVREQENLSQAALAKKMKSEQSFISNVENTRKIPSLNTILNYLSEMDYCLVITKNNKVK